jgi:predicted enzyme related to lactoylglutathione lyase
MTKRITATILAGLAATWLVIAVAATPAPALPALNDTPSGLELPGKFIWFDLATPEIRDQQEYYRQVFGWSFQSPATNQDAYVLIMNNGRAIGGMFNAEPPDGEQDGATWISLMAVSNVDQAVQIAKANEGTVEVQPGHVADRGRHALLHDPAGALFGVLDSDSGDPPDAEVDIGAVFWVDLYTRDIDKMTAFYEALAPYEVTERDIPGEVVGKFLNAHGMPRAGIVEVDEEANRSAWVPYIRVDNVAETLKMAEELGGFAIIPPDEALLDGNLAVFVDPHGAVTGIVKWEYTEDSDQ